LPALLINLAYVFTGVRQGMQGRAGAVSGKGPRVERFDEGDYIK